MRTLLGFCLMGALSLPLAASAGEPEKGAESKAGCEPVRVHFEFNSTTLGEDQKKALDLSAQCLKENEKLRVFVEGNTDPIGTAQYNQDLGAKRAAAVADYLEANGVSPAQLQQISYGEGKPICSGTDESCNKENRNADLRPACRLQ